VSILLPLRVASKRDLSERQVALADRILTLYSLEIIGVDLMKAMMDRLWADLERLEQETVHWESRIKEGVS
jgi:hypothetical protein